MSLFPFFDKTFGGVTRLLCKITHLSSTIIGRIFALIAWTFVVFAEAVEGSTFGYRMWESFVVICFTIFLYFNFRRARKVDAELASPSDVIGPMMTRCIQIAHSSPFWFLFVTFFTTTGLWGHGPHVWIFWGFWIFDTLMDFAYIQGVPKAHSRTKATVRQFRAWLSTIGAPAPAPIGVRA